MSTFKCEVVPVELRPHPNADSLSLVAVYGYTAIVRTVDWQGRDRGVYIPVDAIVPDTPEFAFLGGHRRIKALKLRGIFSMGLLVPAPEGAAIGDDLTAALGITKYDPDLFTDRGGLATRGAEDGPAPPGLAPTYTDIESLRRHAQILVPGEIVIATEKIHGANMRATLRDGVLYVGSRTIWKRADLDHVWTRAARASALADKIRALPPDVVIYGEAYGQVQDLRYGTRAGEALFRAFDIFDPARGHYLDYAEFHDACEAAGIARVPVLHWGPFDYATVEALAEKDSRVAPGQIAEGVVIRPVRERFNPEIGRVILKLHSQRYLLRKGA